MTKRVAVVLSGCGFQDGAEIHESVMTLLALDRQGADYQCFAPDIEQRKVVDHYRQEETSETRNVLVESARIARCNVLALTEFQSSNFDAIIFPGGFGAALNLSSFAIDGPECSVNQEVANAITSMREVNKPIGALCIAPALLGKLIPGVTLTIGGDEGTAEALETMGANHETTTHGEVVVDEQNKVVTTPCYMLDAKVSQIAEGADNAVRALLNMAS